MKICLSSSLECHTGRFKNDNSRKRRLVEMENGYPAKLPTTYGQRTILLLSGSGLRLDGVLGFSLGRTDPSHEPRIIRRCQDSPHQSQVISFRLCTLLWGSTIKQIKLINRCVSNRLEKKLNALLEGEGI